MSGQALVTGGAGFIGSHLTDRLLAEGWEVTVFDTGQSHNLEGYENHPGFRFVEGDIRDKEAVQSLIDPMTDVVYHLSAVVGVKRYLADPLRVIDINVLGTRNVLEAAARHGCKVVLTSTSEVYGKNPKVPWSEEDDRVLGSTGVDRWSYSTSKALCEHVGLAMFRQLGLPITILRYFNVYGPRQAPIYVLSQTIFRALRGERPLLYDSGAQTRCFTYIADAVAGTVAAGLSPAVNGEVINIGSERETTIREAIELVLEVTGNKLGWEDIDTDHLLGSAYQDITRRVPDVTKARRLLGWEAAHSLAQGVAATVEWARLNPWWLNQKLTG